MAEGFDGANSAVKDKLADKIEQIGDTIDERISVLEQQGGAAGKAAPIVQKASSAADATAEYLRNNDLDQIRADLVDQIRERPLLSMGIAFAAGAVVGKMFGSSDDDDEDRPRKRRSSNRSSFLKSQLSGPVGTALMTALTGIVAAQVRDRIAGTSGKTGDQ
jgi:ElaB/YqjD/DUF883 family membrane-anchored ribosome-binding protein